MNMMGTTVALDPRLAQQSLARPLEASEVALARALEEIFGLGVHDFSKVAAALQQRGVARPSGDTAPWDAGALQQELATLNALLDAAYATSGIGA